MMPYGLGWKSDGMLVSSSRGRHWRIRCACCRRRALPTTFELDGALCFLCIVHAQTLTTLTACGVTPPLARFFPPLYKQVPYS